MKKIEVLTKPNETPIYDKATGRFLGWRLAYDMVGPISALSYFFESGMGSSYKRMCRFKKKLQLVSNENNK